MHKTSFYALYALTWQRLLSLILGRNLSYNIMILHLPVHPSVKLKHVFLSRIFILELHLLQMPSFPFIFILATNTNLVNLSKIPKCYLEEPTNYISRVTFRKKDERMVLKG